LALVALQQPTEVAAYFQVLRLPVVVEGGLVRLLLHKAAEQVVLVAVAAQHLVVLHQLAVQETRHQQPQVRVITAAMLEQMEAVLLAVAAVRDRLARTAGMLAQAMAAMVLHLQLQARL
jgi:hypothetical protein